MQTLRDFLETYKGFDYENGEIVIVNQRRADNHICKYSRGELHSLTFHDFTREYEMPVWNWTHTHSTLLIVL